MTLSLEIQERNKQQADETQGHSDPKEGGVRFKGIVCVVAGCCRVLRHAREYRSEDTQADGDSQLDSGLEHRAGDGLLRLGQVADNVHLDKDWSTRVWGAGRRHRVCDLH